jgi:hypothetical protein
MLYLEKSTPIAGISKSVSIDEAHRYNMMMLAHSGRRVFSNSDEYMKHIERSTAGGPLTTNLGWPIHAQSHGA